MDLKQIEYIVKIAEENNITHAAEKLFITQSALNQQLLKLERDLGTPLFYRSRTDWRPTEAGEIYLENAREILRIKKNTYRKIEDLNSFRKGHLSVGFTPGRGIAMFTSVYPKFHKIFPHVTLEPMEISVKKQQAMIANGDLDLGFMTVCKSEMTQNVYIPICSEKIYVAIPKVHPLSSLEAPEGQPFTEISISELQFEPFVLMYKESTIRTLIDQVFEKAGFSPNLLFETSNNSTIVTMIKSNLCCGLIPYYYIQSNRNDMACFALPNAPAWDVVASYKRGNYLSQPAREFVRLASEFFQKNAEVL